jgi:hypothetical protein
MDESVSSFTLDRRSSDRHTVKTALRIRVWNSGLPEYRAESVNLSQRGRTSHLKIATRCEGLAQ